MANDLDEMLDTSGLTLEDLNELMGEDPSEGEAGAAPAVAGTNAAPFQFLRSPRSRTGVDLEYALFFDLETVPDESRMHTFGLPDLPQVPPACTLEECPPIDKLLEGSIAAIEDGLRSVTPPEGWLESVREFEQGRPKPRKGVFDAIDKVIKERADVEAAVGKRLKLLSTTPEFCRIVAIGSAAGASEAQALATDEERAILRFFWDVAEKATHFIGWNVLNFDLQVLLVRSAILGVEPTCVIDRSPYGGKVIDLMQQRFGRAIPSINGGMKDQARLHGIEVPAGNTRGGDVYDLWKQERWGEIAAYVCSDVEVGRELFHRMSGYWFM